MADKPDLSQVDISDLVDEIGMRGVGCVVALQAFPETDDEAEAVLTYRRGSYASALGMVEVLRESLKPRVESQK